jgi:hypothetical protein
VGWAGLQPAHAQTMAISFSNPAADFVPALSAREVNIIARVLGMSDADREAMMLLHSGHVAAVSQRKNAISDEVQEGFEEAQALGDTDAAKIDPGKRDNWTKEAKQLKDAFFEDLKSLLTKEQADRWPLVERELRRFKSLPSGRFAGEKLDVIAIVDESYPHAWKNPAISDALVAYAASLDSLLKARDAYLSEEKKTEFDSLCKTDKPQAERLWRDAVAARAAVRDLNLRTADQIAAMLASNEGEQLRRQVLCDSYSKLCSQSRSESFIRAASKLNTLSAEQRATINDIVNAYEVRSNALIREIAAATREREVGIKPMQLEPSSGSKVATTAEGETITFYSSEDLKPTNDDPLVPLTKRRHELDRDTRRSIERVLTPEQRDACRQPPIGHIQLGEHSHWGL